MFNYIVAGSRKSNTGQVTSMSKCYALPCRSKDWKIEANELKVRCHYCDRTFHPKCSGFDDANAENFAKMVKYCDHVKYYCLICKEKGVVDLIKHYSEKTIAYFKKELDVITQQLTELPKLKDDVNEKIDGLSVLCDKSEPWSTVVRKKSNKAPSVVIKPKNLNTKRDEIRKTLNEKLDSAEYGFVEARMSSKNGLIISCDNKAKQEEFASKAEQVLGDKFDVKCNKELMPRMKIISVIVDNDLADMAKVETLLSDRNVELKNAEHAKVVFMFQRKKYESATEKCFDVIMEVDKQTYKHFVSDGNRIKLAWMSCHVYDGTYIKRCSKCLGFGHNKDVCKREAACIKCGGNHLRKDCKSAEERCANCQRVNALAKKEVYAINHGANCNECPSLMQQKDRMRSMINFE